MRADVVLVVRYGRDGRHGPWIEAEPMGRPGRWVLHIGPTSDTRLIGACVKALSRCPAR